MVPEDDYRPYPFWFPWFFGAMCIVLVTTVLTQ
jgi:hypothetical protein